jgi:RluA family pseudouridine synthase
MARPHILHADRHLIIASKPPGLDVHGRSPDDPSSFVALVARELGLPPRQLHPASRLDRPVSGLVPLARSKIARQSLTQQYQERLVHRTYVALASAIPDPPSGRWDKPVSPSIPGGGARRGKKVKDLPAVTDYEILETLGSGCSLVELRPQTGRTHQLRIHLSQLGRAPILGDRRYGGPSSLTLGSGAVIALPRVMLHAKRIRLSHPATGEPFELEAPLWDDFQALLERLGRFSG